MELFPDLFSFYRFTTPLDAFGKIKFDNRVGPAQGSQRDPQKSNLDAKLTEMIMEQFVTKAISGAKSIKEVKASPAAGNNKNLLALSEKGVYNGLYQAALNPTTEYLTFRYWKYPKQTKTEATPGKKSSVEISYTMPGNFLGQICGGDITKDKVGPPIDLTVALMRAPMLSPTRSNTDIIQLYLTAMPAPIANRLMPYCDVEFQIPFLQSSAGTGLWDDGVVNRPSLYRFLMGSGQNVNSLTEGDKSLTLVSRPNQQSEAAARRAGSSKDAQNILNNATTSFFGAEMFTTPQTLMNMNTLRRTSLNVPGARITTAKPFLPPATITNISITVQNAGAGTYGKRSATLTMKIHDKARLAEFGEFFRGNKGYSEATVWLTYGMLAPRGGEDDEYAKLINQNMLVREAYMISNSTFSFNIDGSIDVNLTLAQKVTGQLSIATISLGSSITNVKTKLAQAIGYVRDNASKYGEPRSEKEGFSAAEVRIAQYISSVAEGNLDSGADKGKLVEDFKQIEDLLRQLESSTKPGPKGAQPSATLQDIQKRRPGFDIATVKEMIAKLKDIYGINTSGKDQPQGLKDQFKNTGVNFALSKLTKAANEGEPDPFFPDAQKNIIDKSGLKTGEVKYAQLPIRNFSDKFIESCRTTQKGTREYVSFGKIFSLFCIEPLLYSVANEFGWTKEQQAGKSDQCPYELQVIFYQLNKNCGPASGHNIAELPLDITIFSEAFGQLAEARGGDDVTLSEFIEFLNDQLSDPRHPGYGRRPFYKPIPADKKTDNEKRFELVPINEKDNKFEDNLSKWTRDYGSSFVTPLLTINIEVQKEGLVNGNASSTYNNSLLFDLAGRVGSGAANPPPRKGGDPKTIVKVHVFDRTFSPFENIAKVLKQTPDGNYVIFDTEDNANAFALKEKDATDKNNDAPQKLPEGYVFIPGNPATVTIDGEQVGVVIGRGKEALKEYLGAMIPRIEIGTNGTLISSIGLASKTSGLEGTIAMMGGTQKRELSIGSTGLSQEQFNQPMVVYPAQLQMTTMGCPIAQMQQNFFVDFGTETTLDNNYVVQRVTHNITQGKFETQWELGYYDGYGRMFNAGKVIDLIKELEIALKPPQKEPVTLVRQPADPNRRTV